MKTATVAYGTFRVLSWLAVSAIPVAWLELARLVAGTSFTWRGLAARWALTACLLLASHCARPHRDGDSRVIWPWSGIVILIATGCAAIFHVTGRANVAAGFALASLYILLLGLERGLTSSGSTVSRWGALSLIHI